MSYLTTVARRWFLAGGAIMVAAAVSAVPMASASTSSCHSANGFAVNSKTAGSAAAAKLVCSGLKAYAGQTITFVAPDNVGGGFDQNARVYAPYLSKYLGATVNVLNVPAGNTVAGQNYVAATNTNRPGYTVGWMNAGPDVEDTVLGIAGIQFNPVGEAMLGGTAANITLTAAYKSPACAAWDTNFAGLLANNSASNPVSEPIQTTGSTTFNEMLLNGVFGIHYHAIPGYASSTQLLSGWVRGDGCVITDPASTLGPYIVAGKAVPLIVNIPLQTTNQYYPNLIGVPTYAEAEKQYKKYITNRTARAAITALNEAAITQRVFFVPPKTPQNLQAALRQAFKWASYNPNLQHQFLAIGSPTGYTDPKFAKSSYIAYLNAARKVTNFLTAIK